MHMQPQISIIVSPREKFSLALRSLESLLAETSGQYELIYVDGGSPKKIRNALRELSEKAGFTLIRTDYYLSPNQARSLGLAHAHGKYIVFIDNDVIFTPGWLQKLVACADETGAALVIPLVCECEPVHTSIHYAGGDCGIRDIETEQRIEKHLFDRIFDQNKPAAIFPKERVETNLVEYHCVLARRDMLDRIGGIDTRIMSTREHVDLSLSVRQAGGTIYLEPDALVTFLHKSDLTWYDALYFMVRWSDEWERQSILHLASKWNLSINGLLGYKLQNLGWRRRDFMIRPFVKRLTGGLGGEMTTKVLTQGLIPVERVFSKALYAIQMYKIRRDAQVTAVTPAIRQSVSA